MNPGMSISSKSNQEEKDEDPDLKEQLDMIGNLDQAGNRAQQYASRCKGYDGVETDAAHHSFGQLGDNDQCANEEKGRDMAAGRLPRQRGILKAD